MKLNIKHKMLKLIGKRYPSAAKWYRDFRNSQALKNEPEMIPLGFKFNGNAAMQAGTFEPQETEIITEYLKNAEVFVNIGANIGYYCCIALQQNIPTLAFEPVELNLKYLYKNIRANGWQNKIEIFPLALSDTIGLIEIYGGGTGASLIPGWAGAPDYFRQWVPVSTADTILGSRLEGRRCLVLVDIEGAEFMMLKGAAAVLTMTPKPTWIMEITIKEHLPKGISINPNLLQTFEIFWNHGYRAWTCNREKRGVERDEIQEIVKTGKDTLGTHNFIFEPNQSAQTE